MRALRTVALTILFASFSFGQAGAFAQAGRVQAAPPPPSTGKVSLKNAPLANVVDALARRLGIEYALDPTVARNVLITSYGDSRGAAARDVLDLIVQNSRTTMVPDGGTCALVFLKRMPANRLSRLILQLSGEEPVEVARNASSDVLVIMSRRRL